MKTALLIILIISSLVLISAILLSPGKAAGMSGAIAGGAESLFGKKKAKGFEGVLEKATKISAVLFMLSAFVYSII
jgi:preprotein translocase subunit SecG